MQPWEFAKKFKYERGPVFWGGWKDLTTHDNPTGDCGSYAYSMSKLAPNAEHDFFLCWSPRNGIIPRHVVLRRRNQWGTQWTDSTNRKWRPRVDPHRIAIRIPKFWVALRALQGRLS